MSRSYTEPTHVMTCDELAYDATKRSLSMIKLKYIYNEMLIVCF